MAQEQLPNIDLVAMIGRAIAVPELAALFRESGLTQPEIERLIQLRLPEILSVVSESQPVLEKAEIELQAADEQVKKTVAHLKPLRAQSFLTGVYVTLSLLIVAFIPYTIYEAVQHGWRSIVNWRSAISAFLSFAATCAFLLWVDERPARYQEKARLTEEAARKSLNIDGLKEQRDKLRQQFAKNLYEKGILPEITGILSGATAPSYESKLGNFTVTGLSETFSSAHEVETEAKRRIDDLLKLPGGSIGLAGPRGVGKTTLMTLVAARPGKGGKACSIICPAPVEYSGRDFLVTVFLLLCKLVIGEPKGAAEAESVASDGPPRPAWQGPLFVVLGWMQPATLWVGTSLLAVGLLLALLLMSPASSAVKGRSPSPSPATQSSGSTIEVPDNAVRRYLKALDLTPAPMVEWGVLLIVLSVGLLYSFGNVHSRIKLAGFEADLTARDDVVMSPLVKEARAYRDALRFQQSYTSGWSGSLKAPFGFEGGINDARTMSRNQRSLPELVSEFRDFLQKLTAEYGRVVIAIDELDKLESDDKAHLFLNEVKAIFGVPNVFYLVSVSENAVSAFERRGLPFRDVFDSSFDTIVHVDYLKLKESKHLLKRRTTGMPEPFLCFCHCMSGGLPRDLIRSCRDLLEISEQEKVVDLLPLARRVTTYEVRAKARGMAIAASKVCVEPQAVFLSQLTDLLSADLAEPYLIDVTTNLLVTADALREKASKIVRTSTGDETKEATDLEALANLQVEFALYLAYAATVVELFAKPQTAADWIALEKDKSVPGSSILGGLTSVRQALAVSTSVGRERLINFRAAHKMRSIQANARPAEPGSKPGDRKL